MNLDSTAFNGKSTKMQSVWGFKCIISAQSLLLLPYLFKWCFNLHDVYRIFLMFDKLTSRLNKLTSIEPIRSFHDSLCRQSAVTLISPLIRNKKNHFPHMINCIDFSFIFSLHRHIVCFFFQ